jgi:hypothetical protein
MEAFMIFAFFNNGCTTDNITAEQEGGKRGKLIVDDG